MNRERRIIAQDLVANAAEIEKALDMLAAHQVLTYVLVALQERLFELGIGATSSAAGDISNRSAYLAGAFAALDMLDTLPTAILAAQKK